MSGHDGALPNPRGVKLTYDDYVLFPDDGLRHELIDGEHYVTESFGTKHQTILGDVALHLGLWLEKHPIGKLFFAPFDVLFSPFDVVVPDLLYLSSARAQQVLTDDNIQGVPELIVEIAAPNTRRRDETFKRQLYERGGVTEYWVIDPLIDAVHVYHHTGKRFGRPIELLSSEHDVLTTALLPHFDLPLDELFDMRGLSFPSWY